MALSIIKVTPFHTSTASMYACKMLRLILSQFLDHLKHDALRGRNANFMIANLFHVSFQRSLALIICPFLARAQKAGVTAMLNIVMVSRNVRMEKMKSIVQVIEIDN